MINDQKDNVKDNDLTKAIAFLLSKEAEDVSEDKKRSFLLMKMPKETVDEAMKLYPLIQSVINKDNGETNTKGLFSSLFDIGILSSTILVTLGINYLLDFNREKKQILFYHQIQDNLNQLFDQRIIDLRSSVNISLNEYVKCETLENSIIACLDKNSQGKGLTVNLSNKKLKEDIIIIQKDITCQQNEIQALKEKIEINNSSLSQNIQRDIKSWLNSFSTTLTAIIQKQIKHDLGLSSDVSPESQINENKTIINEIINEIESKESQILLLNELINRFKVMHDAFETKKGIIKLNLSNTILVQFNQEQISKVLIYSGLEKVSNSSNLFILDSNRVHDLQKALINMESILHSLSNSNSI